MPLHRHDRHLRPLPPGPSPRLRRRTATSLARSVPVVPPDFDGFLRRAAIRRPQLPTVCRFVAPCSRSWGSPGFDAPVRLLAAGGRGRSACRSTFPLAKTLRSFSLSGSPPARHRGLLPKKESLSREFRVHRGAVPSRRWIHVVRSVLPRIRTPLPRPQGFHHRRVRCRCLDVSVPARLDAPMGFGSIRSDACRAPLLEGWRRPAFYRAVAPGAVPPRLRCPSPPESGEEGKVSACLAPERPMLGADPKVGGPPFRLARSPKTAALPVRPVHPEGQTRIGRWFPPTRRPTDTALERAPKSHPCAGRDPEGNPPLLVRFTRRCSVSSRSPADSLATTRRWWAESTRH